MQRTSPRGTIPITTEHVGAPTPSIFIADEASNLFERMVRLFADIDIDWDAVGFYVASGVMLFILLAICYCYGRIFVKERDNFSVSSYDDGQEHYDVELGHMNPQPGPSGVIPHLHLTHSTPQKEAPPSPQQLDERLLQPIAYEEVLRKRAAAAASELSSSTAKQRKSSKAGSSKSKKSTEDSTKPKPRRSLRLSRKRKERNSDSSDGSKAGSDKSDHPFLPE